MKSINFNLVNCHGIKKLSDNFSFVKPIDNYDESLNYDTVMVYAPNGTMKTSFTNTFRDLCNGDSPQNLVMDQEPIFNGNIILDNGEKLPLKNKNDFNENILVIESFKEGYNFTESSDLIVNKNCKEKFDEITSELNDLKNNLLKKLKKISKIKVSSNSNLEETIENEFQIIFNMPNDNILKILLSIKPQLKVNESINVEGIKYDLLFGNKVQNALKNENLKQSINDYIKYLDSLLDKSKIYSKEGFNTTNLNKLVESIEKNNLFNAKHKIKFNRIGKPVSSLEELQTLINKENEKILKDEELKRKFFEIDKQLNKNNDLIEFRDFLFENQFFIKRLQKESTNQLKREYWLSLLNQEKELYYGLINLYESKKETLNNIKNKSANEKTKWEDVVDKFNDRFHIPFKLKIANKSNVILNGKVPNIEFYDTEFDSEKPIDWSTVTQFYSEGQKRAFYLLNILYEIELRKELNHSTLLIIDDIADSFDYENKYAIIQYLKDLSEDDKFQMIILTHNFDFYRTVKSRLRIHRKNTYFAIKSKYQIILKEFNIENNQHSIFKVLKDKINNNMDLNAFLSLIPFIRNLSEFMENQDEVYQKLTNILHYKDEGKNYNIKDFQPIYENFGIVIPNFSETIYELIFKQADMIQDTDKNDVNLENKIVLSMAIRLLADKFMLKKLSLNSSDITSNQTQELYDSYKKQFGEKTEESQILERVNMMTPENIHINSFMYEPIIDMDDFHLKKLYEDVKNLN